MLNWSDINLNKDTIMKVFWEKIAGREMVRTGRMEYHRPLNYKTDEKEVIINEDMPILNLKNNNLELFENVLTTYVQEFFESELYWANPLGSCDSMDDKLVHAISCLWLNATPEDFENPIQFIQRYTNFLENNMFDEFWKGKKISQIKTLHSCDIEIKKSEQEEFQETPTAINITVIKDNIEKMLPRVAYGISNDTAYIYGIQGYRNGKDEEAEMKKINRSRYAVNKSDNIPEDYKNLFLKQEPYAYISLFIFLSMLKQKGIEKIVMPSYLPERYFSTEGVILDELQKKARMTRVKNETAKEKRRILREAEQKQNDHQRVQYNITNKFLGYMSRMECDVPGLKILETPEETNGNLRVDISKMEVTPQTNIIFYELYKKIEELMQTREKTDEGR